MRKLVTVVLAGTFELTLAQDLRDGVDVDKRSYLVASGHQLLNDLSSIAREDLQVARLVES